MRNRFGSILMAALVAVTLVASANAEPIQLALFNPIQLNPEGSSVDIGRISLIYGKNTNLTGVDLGLVNHLTGNAFALQWGAVGYVEGNFTGWQNNGFNITKGDITGLQGGSNALYNSCRGGTGIQAGVVNINQSLVGLQWGLVNYSPKMTGLQVGFVNYAASLKGLQLGLVNIIGAGGFMPVFPFLNFSF